MKKMLIVLYVPIIWIITYLNRIIVVDLIQPLIQIVMDLFVSPFATIYQIIILPFCFIVDIPVGLVVTFIMSVQISKDMIKENISLIDAIAIVFGIRKEKKFVSTVNLSDAEWEALYKTNYEAFWDLTVKEYDLSKLPDKIGSLRDDTMIYGESAREEYLSRLRSVVEYNEWTTINRPEVINIQWNALKALKRELQEKEPSEKVYMLDVIRNYEHKYIQY